MAKVKFREGYEALHGTLCGGVFKERNGKTTFWMKQKAVLPENATAEQKARYLYEVVREGCITDIQRQLMDNGAGAQEVMDFRDTISKRVKKIYDKLMQEKASRRWSEWRRKKEVLKTYYEKYENTMERKREKRKGGGKE